MDGLQLLTVEINPVIDSNWFYAGINNNTKIHIAIHYNAAKTRFQRIAITTITVKLIIDTWIYPGNTNEKLSFEWSLNFHFSNLWYNAAYVSCSMHPPLLASKKSFEIESVGVNRDCWGNGKAKEHDLSFPISQPFLLSYSIFLFSFISIFSSLFVFHFYIYIVFYIVYSSSLIAELTCRYRVLQPFIDLDPFRINACIDSIFTRLAIYTELDD